LNDIVSLLHGVLLSCGYQYKKAQRLQKNTLLTVIDRSSGFYVKNYNTVEGIFQVALSFGGDPHIKLPHAVLLNYPEKLTGKLIPHVNFGQLLCYVQEMEADWNPNDLEATYRAIDRQIQATLDDAVKSVIESATHGGALEGEFAAYWLHDETLYILSTPSKSKALKCQFAVPQDFEKPSAKSIRSKELVAYSASEELEYQKWLDHRKLEVKGAVNIPVHYITVKPSRLIGEEWPPKSLQSFMKWLADVDPNARVQIAKSIAKTQGKRHVVLLDVKDQDIVGILIELDLNALTLSRYSSSNRVGKRSLSLSTLASTLSTSRAAKHFSRLKVVRADRQTILSRNRQRPAVGDLRSKRIALIGCGTIGGHVAGLLLRGGAGCGSGIFDLYDDDVFSPENFSRHSLSTSEIGQNKSEALAATLSSATHLARNIQGKGRNFSVTVEEIKKYDIILDATGRPPISKRLAAVVREVIGQRPILIHGFNDGNGRASKVLVDDGGRCYGCMISEASFFNKGLDIRFSDIDLHAEKRISCGSTYTPYDAAVSIITAGMMQEATLNCLEDEAPWTYSEHMFDGNRSRRSRHIPSQLGCNICNV